MANIGVGNDAEEKGILKSLRMGEEAQTGGCSRNFTSGGSCSVEK